MYPLAGQLGPLGRSAARQTYAQRLLALSPLALWLMDETSGSSVSDATGHGYTGTLTSITVNQPGVDGASYYNGGSGVVHLNAGTNGLASAFDTRSGTFACWAKVNDASVWSTAGNRALCRFGWNTSSNYIIVRKSSTNQLEWLYNGASGLRQITSPQTSTAWLHIAFTWSNIATIAYVNGSAVGSAGAADASATALSTDYAALMSQAAFAASAAWYGWMDTAALWTRPLTSGEIASIATV